MYAAVFPDRGRIKPGIFCPVSVLKTGDRILHHPPIRKGCKALNKAMLSSPAIITVFRGIRLQRSSALHADRSCDKVQNARAFPAQIWLSGRQQTIAKRTAARIKQSGNFPRTQHSVPPYIILSLQESIFLSPVRAFPQGSPSCPRLFPRLTPLSMGTANTMRHASGLSRSLSTAYYLCATQTRRQGASTAFEAAGQALFRRSLSPEIRFKSPAVSAR